MKTFEEFKLAKEIMYSEYLKQKEGLGITVKLIGHEENMRLLTHEQIVGIMPYILQLYAISEDFAKFLSK